MPGSSTRQKILSDFNYVVITEVAMYNLRFIF